MNLQALPRLLNDAYAMFDSLQLSVTSLVVAGLLLTLIFLFSVRQAVSWFFKVDDLKRDIREVRGLVIDMEAEIRLLQGLLTQNVKLAAVPNPPAKAMASAQAMPAPSISFPINH